MDAIIEHPRVASSDRSQMNKMYRDAPRGILELSAYIIAVAVSSAVESVITSLQNSKCALHLSLSFTTECLSFFQMGTVRLSTSISHAIGQMS